MNRKSALNINMKRVLFTGGGTAGHITPNIAIMDELKHRGFELEYIGMPNSMEEQLIKDLGITFHSITGGKLRRYFDLRNLTDLFKIVKGFFQSLFLVKRIRPDIVFSKGGFVSCPVVWAAFLCGIPVIIHESDMTPGLANRLSIPFSKLVCCSFVETLKYLPKHKGIHTGLPVRRQLLNGNKSLGLQFCKFDDSRPIIFITGGSQGAESINTMIQESLPVLLNDYQICHQCGKGNVSQDYSHMKDYKQFEYISNELPDVLAMADIVISRAGATTIFEILALKKPNILIPLSDKVSRGDQILNAKSFEKKGYSVVLSEEEDFDIVEEVKRLHSQRNAYLENMSVDSIDATAVVIKVIESYL